jgi:hypothetical protein
MLSRAAAGGMDRKAEEETIVELSATTATLRDARRRARSRLEICERWHG